MHWGWGARARASIETSVKTALDEYGTEDLEEVQENYERMMSEMF